MGSIFEHKITRNNFFFPKEVGENETKRGDFNGWSLQYFPKCDKSKHYYAMVFDYEVYDSFLLCSLLDSWEIFIVAIDNAIPNNTLFIKVAKNNLFNKETRRGTLSINVYIVHKLCCRR